MTDFSEAAKEQRRAYKREWRARNRERVREYQRAYWERRATRAHDEMEGKREAEQ